MDHWCAICIYSIALWLEADEATYQRLVTIYASVGREGDATRTVQEVVLHNFAIFYVGLREAVWCVYCLSCCELTLPFTSLNHTL